MDTQVKMRLENAINSAEPEQQLIKLVEELKQENCSQLAIYELFESYMLFLREEEREAEEDIVTDVLDYIWGWCPASARLFPHSLSNEEVHQYKLSKQTKPEA